MCLGSHNWFDTDRGRILAYNMERAEKMRRATDPPAFCAVWLAATATTNERIIQRNAEQVYKIMIMIIIT